MTILLIGGTGVMGHYLAENLQQMGHQVVITSRSHHESIGSISYWQCDARKDCFLDELRDKHFDAIVDFMGYRTEEFKSRVEILLDSTDHYFFLSSSRVYAESEVPITENSPMLSDVCRDEEYLHTDEYALSKAREEKILRTASQKNWTILRPYITYGRNRLQLEGMEKEEWLYRAIHGRSVLVSRDILDKRTTMTHAADVAFCISRLVGREEAKGEDFNVVGTDNMIWRDVLDIYKDAFLQTGLPFRVREVKSAMDIHYLWAKYQIRYDRLFNRTFSNQKILALIGEHSFVSMSKGVREMLFSFLESPQFKTIDWNLEASKDKLSGECARFSEIEGAKPKLRYLVHRYLR